MNFTTSNDGKEKYQSFTLNAETTHHDPMSEFDASVTAFGASDAESKANMMAAAIKLRRDLRTLIHNLNDSFSFDLESSILMAENEVFILNQMNADHRAYLSFNTEGKPVVTYNKQTEVHEVNINLSIGSKNES